MELENCMYNNFSNEIVHVAQQQDHLQQECYAQLHVQCFFVAMTQN